LSLHCFGLRFFSQKIIAVTSGGTVTPHKGVWIETLIEIQYNGHEDAHAVVRMKDSGAWVDPTIQKYNQPEIFTSIDKLITYWNYGKTMWLSEKHKGISEWKF